jgi:hypothetical protein
MCQSISAEALLQLRRQPLPLHSRRELIRVFRSLDSLNRYVKTQGINGNSVEF